ncbi:MAG TPA: phospho-N-acetylmuramoyl-pentapeptide-transferase, partial [Prolixibacteraceae bacterium]|nr:phospho-N-acetylmuramoyl-pentapeptide-transferase [Prolixibacteraceae bacterium]
MLYYLYEWLKEYQVPGIGMAQYISFRTAGAIILSLIITTAYGKKLIRYLHKKQIGEEIRDLGLEGQLQKKGTPTMGGIIILAGIIIPTLLFAQVGNIYIILMLVTTIWLGLIGFADDYIKVFRKNKQGLAGRFKILGQISLGLMVVATLLLSSEVVIREPVKSRTGEEMKELVVDPESGEQHVQIATHEVKSTKTTIPFIKKNEFDYAWLVSWAGGDANWLRWFVYAVAVILIIVAVSNAANLTDGIDGLATGTSAISGAALGILAYVSGNVIYSNYLNIMYIPNLGEL